VHEDLNSPDAIEGIGPLPLNVRGTTRWNASFAYLDQARDRPNLTILSETAVERLQLDEGRATGVVARTVGERRRLTGERVIVAAGAYNSPALLLRSGIGPEDVLSRHGIDPVATLPVGERLREHFGVPLRFAPSAEMRSRIERHLESNPPFPFNGVIKARTSGCPAGRWNVILLLGLFPGPVLSASVMLMRSEWSGQVGLRSSDPEDLPLVSELSLDSDRDMAAALEGLELGRRLARTDALGVLVDRELSPGPDATPESIRAGGREALTTFFHPVGTCPIGTVTETDGRVRGFANLFVADGSILPEIPPVPTHLTVLAVAEKLAAEVGSAA
jgi:choline dehydrogenase